MTGREKKIEFIKKLEVTNMDHEKVMIDFDTGRYFRLKGAANDIWEILEDGMTFNQICTRLIAVYEVDKAICEEHVESFLNMMVKYQFIKYV